MAVAVGGVGGGSCVYIPCSCGAEGGEDEGGDGGDGGERSLRFSFSSFFFTPGNNTSIYS